MSGSLRLAGCAGSWPGRNRKSKRMCSFAVNSTFQPERQLGWFPKRSFPLDFVTLPILFYADPDSGWLILVRSMCITPESSGEAAPGLAPDSYWSPHAEDGCRVDRQRYWPSMEGPVLELEGLMLPTVPVNLNRCAALPAVSAARELPRFSGSG